MPPRPENLSLSAEQFPQPLQPLTSGINGRLILVWFEGISPATSQSATIPPPPIPPPNSATYWQRPGKRPRPKRRLRDTSEVRKKKGKQASAETSAENYPLPTPATIPKKTSTPLILARAPLRAVEEAQESGTQQEPNEALFIEFDRVSPLSF